MIHAAHLAEIGAASDVYQAGRTEDGFPFTAEVYYVVMTFPNGQRFQHNARFAGCVVSRDSEDGFQCFRDVRPAASAKAERLAARVREAGIFDDAHWHEVDPAYGSDAYVAQGTEFERVLAERQAARDEGFNVPYTH